MTQHKSETKIPMKVIICKGTVFRECCTLGSATSQEGLLYEELNNWHCIERHCKII